MELHFLKKTVGITNEDHSLLTLTLFSRLTVYKLKDTLFKTLNSEMVHPV